MTYPLDRRAFLSTGLAAATLSMTAGQLHAADDDAPEDVSLNGRVFRSVKWGMIGVEGSVADKFRLMKSLGYHGMELESPIGLDAKEVRAASQASGMPVHGVVNMRHWNVRLSDPDQDTRDQSRAILEECLQESKAFGGDSVLLVPGAVRGEQETHDDVWNRSIPQIRKTLPLASRLGVRILIENVWNGFCETPDELRDYIDEIDSPWVGVYFDIGNARKFAPSEEWIRTLGSRIVKLDVKGWSQEHGFNSQIGDGDVDWRAVRLALDHIGFTGWSTAEVGGGGEERLAEIGQRMDRVFQLQPQAG